MVPPIVCQLCCIPFDVHRIRKFNDHANTAIAFNGPGRRRTLDNWGQGNDVMFEEALKRIAAAKTEESMEDLLGGFEICRAREGCRRIGIAPNNDPLGHYAGPNCSCTGGYSGYKISFEEMIERTRVQCLTPIPSRWAGSPPPGRTRGDLDGTPYGLFVEEGKWTNLSNEYHGMPLEGMCDLPMHPSCFEIFQRMSMRRFGKVDLGGLWYWREDDSTFEINDREEEDIWRTDESRVWTRFDGFPQPTDLGIVLQDEYECHPGTEYLAADPMNIPGLDELIKSGSEGRVSDIAFSSPRTASKTRDVFSTVPIELRRTIAEVLPRKDVANLRIASANFTELPQSYFHHLIKTEMPWVWEVEDLHANEVNWYGLWRKLSTADGGSYEDEKKRVWARRQLKMLTDRAKAELERQGGEKEPADRVKLLDAAIEEAKEEVMNVFRILNRQGVWSDKKATELRGLRNRRRIYCDIETILTRIQVLQNVDG